VNAFEPTIFISAIASFDFEKNSRSEFENRPIITLGTKEKEKREERREKRERER
jgi:hypothetical protein